uniref:Uncharacterized protein n=1 Tax=Cacopsylla melanoneura TaxID=428564 RepID=A0A8D9FHA4_9HEMI
MNSSRTALPVYLLFNLLETANKHNGIAGLITDNISEWVISFELFGFRRHVYGRKGEDEFSGGRGFSALFIHFNESFLNNLRYLKRHFVFGHKREVGFIRESNFHSQMFAQVVHIPGTFNFEFR